LKIIQSLWFACAFAGLASCNEATAPLRRYPVLDDVGSALWLTVSAGGDHTCALTTDGTAYCWGSNRYGQLGIAARDTTCGDGGNAYPCSLVPRAVQTAAKFTSISAGLRHTCGITTQREAFCWGANDASQIGDFASSGPTLVKVPGTLPWVQISAGATHTCAVRSDGLLFCWGASDRGQLGNGSFISSSEPGRVSLNEPVASVSAGQQRTCARTTAGTVYCWGAIWTSRESGLEVSRAATIPELVAGAPAMSSLSVGTFTTCGTDASGFVYCWEANPRGELGDGTLNGSTVPTRIASDLQFVEVTSGVVHSCGLVIDGTGYCWGDDTFGELGVPPVLIVDRCGGQTLPCTKTPLPVIGRQRFTEISAGLGSHTCGVTTQGNLYCWGLGASGQRGDGTMITGVSTPLKVAAAR
jgi:alpha-tubulin suppressor-like RCC1 family protein